MSIEANTYEQMHIMNCNEQTKAVALAVGNYLKATWGITQLILTVDGKNYHSDTETLDENPEVLAVCDNLSEAKEINFTLRSSNNGGLRWRQESGFLQKLENIPELMENVEYKSVDYYDQDSGVDLYHYDRQGSSDLQDQWKTNLDCVKNIERWYSYSPEICIKTDETENEELHQKICTAFNRLIQLTESDEDALEDDWEYGEMIWEGALSFTKLQMHEVVEVLRNIDEAAAGSDTQVRVSISAVPDGERDYEFAALLIRKGDKEIKAESCIF